MIYRFALVLLFATTVAYSQGVTTFILVRHAEKMPGAAMGDNSKDPELSEEGKQRAIRLAEILRDRKIDAVYSTDYKRTKLTVTPLAQLKGLDIILYQPMKPEAVDEMQKKFAGKTIVVCGHSNTTPWMANYLLGSNYIKDFEDGDYGNMILVEVGEKGKSKLIWSRY